MAGNDFVMVQLTKRGEELAAGATIGVSNERRSFVFEAAKPQRVEKSYEWNVFLRNHVTPLGEYLFELVPPAPAAVAAPSAVQAPIQEKK